MLEFTYYDKELKRARTELEKMDAQRTNSTTSAAETSRQVRMPPRPTIGRLLPPSPAVSRRLPPPPVISNL